MDNQPDKSSGSMGSYITLALIFAVIMLLSYFYMSWLGGMADEAYEIGFSGIDLTTASIKQATT